MPEPSPSFARDPSAAGHPSAAELGIETLRRLNASAPGRLVSRAQRARLVGERKPVTAVFADIVGSTSLSESIDPEEWTFIINAAFDEMSRCIFEFEGTIAQLQGDAIISFFGAPVAHEDDPERAVRAALAMNEAMERYRSEVEASHGIDFRIRTGISTGLVMVGHVGSDLRYDYTAIGDTMNVASRLQGAAGPGQILIAERTERFVRALFELEPVGPLDLKGKASAVMAFRVSGVRERPARVRGVEGLESTMVGRDDELATLLGLVTAVRAGRGRTAVIIADPGLGKSRLIEELRSAVSRQGDARDDDVEMAWVTAHARSYGQRMPFHVVSDLVLGCLGLTRASPKEEIETALQVLLASTIPDDGEAADYLAILLGLAAADDDALERNLATGELLADRLHATVLRLLRALAQQGPLGIVMEDVHWTDPASVDLLSGILTVADDAPACIILTTRDEPEAPGWQVIATARQRTGHALTELRLEPLTEPSTRTLVGTLLEIESLPDAVRDVILTKAEGNPFFVEEVIRMLIDAHVITRDDGRWRAVDEGTGGTDVDVSIPDTLHGLILARIDRLPPEARRLLRLASCIDRQFPLGLLEDVARAAGVEEGFGSALGRLEAADLLVLVTLDADVAYRFRHALTQDAAYETVLRHERREWHRLIAETILSRDPAREGELADQLARHFELAADVPRAIHYLLMAADRALARNALLSSGQLYGHAQGLMSSAQPATHADELADRQRLRILLGLLASSPERYRDDEVAQMIREARDLAERAEDPVALSDVLFWEVAQRQAAGDRPGESAELQALLDELDALPAVPGHEAVRAQALTRSGRLLWWNGEFARSIEALEHAGKLFEAHGDAIGASMAGSYAALDLANLGDFAEADRRMEGSRRSAEAADALARLDFHLAEAGLAAIRGDHRTSMRYASECLEGSSRLGALACATVSGVILGTSQVALGEVAGAKASLERSIELAVQGYLAPLRLRGNVVLASAEGLSGHMATAEAGFRSALSAFLSMGGGYGLAETQLARGLVLATHPDGDADRALEDLDAAAETFTRLGARPALARAERGRGMALLRAGRRDEADVALGRAASMAAEMGLLDGPWPRTARDLEVVRDAPAPILPAD